MSCAMKVIDELYWISAMNAEIATNTTSRPRIQMSCLRSSISFTMWRLMRSSVSVEDEVSTSEDSVDIDADSTSTTTRPMSSSGSTESIVGTMESYTGVTPSGPKATWSAKSWPKPPRK